MRRLHTSAAVGALLALAGPLVGCGAPTNDRVRVIEPSEVPYHLLEDTTVVPSGPASDTTSGPRLYWIDPQNRMVPRSPASYCVRTLPGLSRVLLSQLAAGPSESDLAHGLGTALPPPVWISVVEIEDRTALLSISGDETFAANRVDLAVAQAVLTLTSIAGVDRVEVQSDGTPLQVPLPSGELATGSLRRDDYRSLLVDPGDEEPSRQPSREILCPG